MALPNAMFSNNSPASSRRHCSKVAQRLNPDQTRRYPDANSIAVVGTRLELVRRTDARVVTNSTVGAAVGRIIATIITHHMTKISAAYGGLPAGGLATICPPAVCINSISM